MQEQEQERRHHRLSFLGVIARALPFLALFACAGIVGFPDRVLDQSAVADGGAPGDEGGATPIPPGVTFSKTSIDMVAPCGGASPIQDSVTISNGAGGTPITWTATLSDTTTFAISGAAGATATGTVAPNATAAIEITAVPAPLTTEAGSTTQAVLTITTNSADKPKTDIPLKVVASGATLAADPVTADFGEASVGKPAGVIPVVLKNTGNLAVQVAITPPTDAQFGLSWSSAPQPVTLAPGASTSLAASFTPTKVSPSSSMVMLAPVGGATAMCGTSDTVITLSGKGSPSTAAVQPGALDFGLVDCGTAGAAQTLTIINSGPTAFTWTATQATPSMYVLSKTTDTVAANSSEEITVTPNAIPTPSKVAPNLYGEPLTITTTAANDVPHAVDLRMTGQGVILAQSTPTINFSSVRITTTQQTPFVVTNSGNVTANIAYAVVDPTFAIAPANAAITAGSTATLLASFSPTQKKSYSTTATMGAGSVVLCKPLPSPLVLNGKGATSATLTPASVGFGSVACGTQAVAQSVALTNIGAASFTWTATLGTAFYSIAPSSGTVLPGDFITINVTPNAIPATSSTLADFYADTLTVNTVPANESPYTTSLHMTAKGAILSFNPTSISFGNVAVGGNSAKAFTVTNDGNAMAATTLSAVSSSASTFSVTPLNKALGAGNSFNPNVHFTPTSTGAKTGSVSITTTDTTCAPLPSPVQVSGSGT